MIWKVAKAVHLHVLLEGLLLQECGPPARKRQPMRGWTYGTRTLDEQLKASLKKERQKAHRCSAAANRCNMHNSGRELGTRLVLWYAMSRARA